MGYDRDKVIKHTGIKTDNDIIEEFDRLVDTIGTKIEGVVTNNQTLSNINFYSHNATILLTLTKDGRMILGPGISKEKATHEIAEMLVAQYSKLFPTPDR